MLVPPNFCSSLPLLTISYCANESCNSGEFRSCYLRFRSLSWVGFDDKRTSANCFAGPARFAPSSCLQLRSITAWPVDPIRRVTTPPHTKIEEALLIIEWMRLHTASPKFWPLHHTLKGINSPVYFALWSFAVTLDLLMLMTINSPKHLTRLSRYLCPDSFRCNKRKYLGHNYVGFVYTFSHTLCANTF